MRFATTPKKIGVIASTLSAACAALGLFAALAAYLQTDAVYWLLALTGSALGAALTALVVWMYSVRRASASVALVRERKAEVMRLREPIRILSAELAREVRFDEGARKAFAELLGLLVTLSSLAQEDPFLDGPLPPSPEIRYAQSLLKNLRRSLLRAHEVLTDTHTPPRDAIVRAHEDVLLLGHFLQTFEDSVEVPTP